MTSNSASQSMRIPSCTFRLHWMMSVKFTSTWWNTIIRREIHGLARLRAGRWTWLVWISLWNTMEAARTDMFRSLRMRWHIPSRMQSARRAGIVRKVRPIRRQGGRQHGLLIITRCLAALRHILKWLRITSSVLKMRYRLRQSVSLMGKFMWIRQSGIRRKSGGLCWRMNIFMPGWDTRSVHGGGIAIYGTLPVTLWLTAGCMTCRLAWCPWTACCMMKSFATFLLRRCMTESS